MITVALELHLKGMEGAPEGIDDRRSGWLIATISKATTESFENDLRLTDGTTESDTLVHLMMIFLLGESYSKEGVHFFDELNGIEYKNCMRY